MASTNKESLTGINLLNLHKWKKVDFTNILVLPRMAQMFRNSQLKSFWRIAAFKYQ